jgi:hypothetical protein
MPTLLRKISNDALILKVLLCICACGTVVGNPRRPSETGGAGDPGKPPTKITEVPTFDFEIPDEVADPDSKIPSSQLQLAQVEADPDIGTTQTWTAINQDTDVLRHFMRQIVTSLRGLNVATKLFNKSDELKEKGFYKNAGLRKNQSAKIEAIADDPDYQFRLVACQDDTPFLEIKWDEKSEHLSSTFVPRIALSKPEDERFYTNLTIVSKGGDSELLSHGSGKTLAVDPTGNGSRQANVFRVVRPDSGDLQYRAVTSWYDPSSDPQVFPPTRYVSASSTKAGEGEVAAWGVRCPKEFDETKPENPGWCFARRINAKVEFTAGERQAAVDRLTAVGIEQASSLHIVKFADNVTCPN